MRKINPKFVKAVAFWLISFYNEGKEYKIYIMFLYLRKVISFRYDYKKFLIYIPIIAITCTMIAFLLYFLPIDSRPFYLSLFTFPFSLPPFFQQKKVSTFIFAGFIDGVLKTGLFLLGIKPVSITLPFLVVYRCVSLIAYVWLFLFKKKLNE